MKNTKQILILEQDEKALKENCSVLEQAGYEVLCTASVAEARKQIRQKPVDLLLLDIPLSDGIGLSFCKEAREETAVRIMFLSDRSERQSIMEGLLTCGDDYLFKPYLTEDLLLRVQALLSLDSTMRQGHFFTGPLEWNQISLQVFIRGRDLLLQPREYSILRLLCSSQGRYVSGEELYRQVWNSPVISSLSPVHNHIYSLRAKLSRYGIHIESARGEGYRILL